jgi:hypothetical protein
MDKEAERWLIIVLVLILIGAGMSGCAKPQVNHDEPKEPTTLETIGRLDAIVTVLGCMFDPAPCQKMAEEQRQQDGENN